MWILEPRGAAPHAVMSAQGVMVAPDGSAQRVRVKGGSLFEALHGIGEAFRRRIGRDLGTSKTDLGLAYTSEVWTNRCIKLRADALAGVPLVLLCWSLRRSSCLRRTSSDSSRECEGGAEFAEKIRPEKCRARLVPGENFKPNSNYSSLKFLLLLIKRSIDGA